MDRDTCKTYKGSALYTKRRLHCHGMVMFDSLMNSYCQNTPDCVKSSFVVLSGLQRRRLIPALTLDSSSSSSPSHRSSKQAITSSSSSSSSPGACWVDGPLGPPAPSNLRGATATTETFEIKVYEIDDVERLQKRRDKVGSKVRGREETHLCACRAEVCGEERSVIGKG